MMYRMSFISVNWKGKITSDNCVFRMGLNMYLYLDTLVKQS